jgi:hypothetical protein
MPAESQPVRPKAIDRPKLLAVEGNDAKVFFLELLRSLDVDKIIEVRDFGGVNDLPHFLETIMITPGFEQVVSFGIIRDAEQGAISSAFQSVKNSLKKVGLSAPKKLRVATDSNPRISVFILPDCENQGMLETLCLQSVSTDQVFPCIETFFQCVEKTVGPPANMDKARLHAYLASRPKPHLSFQQATIAHYWPWDHPVFDLVKDFLRGL